MEWLALSRKSAVRKQHHSTVGIKVEGKGGRSPESNSRENGVTYRHIYAIVFPAFFPLFVVGSISPPVWRPRTAMFPNGHTYSFPGWFNQKWLFQKHAQHEIFGLELKMKYMLFSIKPVSYSRTERCRTCVNLLSRPAPSSLFAPLPYTRSGPSPFPFNEATPSPIAKRAGDGKRKVLMNALCKLNYQTETPGKRGWGWCRTRRKGEWA